LERRVSGSLVTRDASSTNVIYDASNNRARLIDFEIYHEEIAGRVRATSGRPARFPARSGWTFADPTMVAVRGHVSGSV